MNARIDSKLIELANSAPIFCISEKDNGDNRRYHKKKRIRKKWRKMYGTVSTALEAGDIVITEKPMPCLFMSRKTYSRLKSEINRQLTPKSE